MKMTKKDLKRRNKFLLLQIKIIKELLEDAHKIEREELYKKLGAVDYYTNPVNIKKNIRIIEENDLEYNFLNELMDINEYED